MTGKEMHVSVVVQLTALAAVLFVTNVVAGQLPC